MNDPKFVHRNEACIHFKRYDPDRIGSIPTQMYKLLHSDLVFLGLVNSDMTYIEVLLKLDGNNESTIELSSFVKWIDEVYLFFYLMMYYMSMYYH